METAPFRVAFECFSFGGGGHIQLCPGALCNGHLPGACVSAGTAPPGAAGLGFPVFFGAEELDLGPLWCVTRAGIAPRWQPPAPCSPGCPRHVWGQRRVGGDTPADATQPAWPWLTSGCPSWVLPSGGRLPSRNFHNGSAAGFGPESAAFRPVLVYQDFTRCVRGCCWPFGEGLLGHPPASIG